jgi:hypothetical protein
MQPFVHRDSIVRKIWGNSDTILLVFAGAAAEFALNKAVDWLYFTNKLPSDPLGRLFSTVNYAKAIVFADQKQAINAIDTITQIHKSIEKKRGSEIPEWAYKDVLFMLIDYSIRAYELLERPLTRAEKEDVLGVFRRVGCRMGLRNSPCSYGDYQSQRLQHLTNNLEYSSFTIDLYDQYKVHLGKLRFYLLLEAQRLILPERVKTLFWTRRFSLIKPLIGSYRLLRSVHLDRPLKNLILPKAYQQDIDALNFSN